MFISAYVKHLLWRKTADVFQWEKGGAIKPAGRGRRRTSPVGPGPCHVLASLCTQMYNIGKMKEMLDS